MSSESFPLQINVHHINSWTKCNCQISIWNSFIRETWFPALEAALAMMLGGCQWHWRQQSAASLMDKSIAIKPSNVPNVIGDHLSNLLVKNILYCFWNGCDLSFGNPAALQFRVDRPIRRLLFPQVWAQDKGGWKSKTHSCHLQPFPKVVREFKVNLFALGGRNVQTRVSHFR